MKEGIIMSKLGDKKLTKLYPKILFVGALIGLIASFWQVVERINMLKTPGLDLSCDLNPVIECGSVLNDRLAALFGFPNALLGIVMFTVLLTIGLLLLAGSELKKWFWKILLAVLILLILFSFWFFAVSLYVIGKICLFCIFIWIVSVPLFLYGVDWLIANNYLKAGWTKSKAITFAREYQTEILITTYVVMLLLFFFRFRDFYF